MLAKRTKLANETEQAVSEMKKRAEVTLFILFLETMVASLLGVYPKDVKSPCPRVICILVLITALFMFVKTWTQSSCLSTHD